VSGDDALAIGTLVAVVFIFGTIGIVLYLQSDLFPRRERCPSCRQQSLRRVHRLREPRGIDGEGDTAVVDYWRCSDCHSRFRRPSGIRLDPLTDEEWERHCGTRL
jgi:hypothetical protein